MKMSTVKRTVLALLLTALTGAYQFASAQSRPALLLSGSCPESATVGLPFSIPLVASGGTGNFTFAIATGPSWAGLSASSGIAVNGRFSLTVSGTPPASGTFPLEVAVYDDAQDPPGSFNCSLVVVNRPLTLTGTCPATLAANTLFSLSLTASGGNGNYRFSISGPTWLSISNTGVVSGTPPTGGSFPFTVTLNDTAGTLPTATFSCTLNVTAPPLSLTGTCPATLAVNAPFSLSLSPSGGNGSYRYSIVGASWLSVSSAGVVTGTPPAAGSFPFIVTLNDSAGTLPAATFSCTLNVTAPPLSLTGTCPATLAANTPFSLSLTAIGGNGNYRFSISGPTWLSISNTGVVSGTPPTGGSFPFTVTLNDTAGTLPAATFSCSLNVISPLSLTGACPTPIAISNLLYTLPFTISGGSGSYQISASAPAWLQLSASSGRSGANGTFTFNLAGIAPAGAPQNPSVYSIGVQVTDTNGSSAANYSCSVTVNSSGSGLALTSGCPVSPVVQGTAYNQVLSASGGDGSFFFSIVSGSLPSGLSLSGNVIAGTALAPTGTSFFVLQVSSAGTTAQLACSITVVIPPPVTITSSCPANGLQGSPYGPFSLNATGGLGSSSYLFSVVNGTLPAGLTLVNGVVSGTPAGPPGISVLTFQVASGDLTGRLGPCSFTIDPASSSPPLRLAGVVPSGVTTGVPFSISLTASGGAPPYALAVTSGEPWLMVSGTGASATVTGTAPLAGTFPFTISLTDSTKTTAATFSFILVVTDALNIQAAPSYTVQQNSPLSLPLVAMGGRAPYQWTLTGPDWLSLSPATGANVTLSGTPPDPGTFTFTVTVTDAAGASISFTSTLIVRPQAKLPLVITPSAPCPTSLIGFGSTFSLSFTASGGTEPYNFSLSDSPWLKLGSKTGPTTTVSGVANVEGPAPFTLSLDDSAGSTTATFSCTVTVGPVPIPTLTLSPPLQPATLFVPLPVVATLASASPVALEGDLQLTFTPNAFGTATNPQVTFLDPLAIRNGSVQTLHFSIPQGAVTMPLTTIQQGTVAGTIRVELIALRAGTRDVLAAAHPSFEFTITRMPAVITGLTFENETANGFDIRIQGYATPRDVASAELTFSPAPGASIQGSTTFSVTIADLFASFYGSSRSQDGGSMFDGGLRIPISVSGDKTAIGSVSVKLVNSAGASAVATKSR